MPVGEARAKAWSPAVYAASWSRSTMFCCVTMTAAERALDHEPPGRLAGDGAGHGGHDALAELLLEGERGEQGGHRVAAAGRRGGGKAEQPKRVTAARNRKVMGTGGWGIRTPDL